MNDHLPDALRRRFAAAFGLDLSAIQFHADSAEADELGVEAFTRGREIHFAPGRFDPVGAPQLIAHELAHVVQQSEGSVAPTLRAHGGQGLNNDAGLERAADADAARAMRGEPVRQGPQLAPRTVDVAQAYFRSDSNRKKLQKTGRYIKTIYNHLLHTQGPEAAELFQDAADDDDVDHGTLSKAGYDLDAAQAFKSGRVGRGGDDTADATPIKRRRVGKSTERSKVKRGKPDKLPEEPKRKQRAKSSSSGDGSTAPMQSDSIALPTSTSSPLTAWPETQSSLAALSRHAPGRGDATASWRHYWTALQHDLAALDGVRTESYDALLRGVTAVMLYKIHIASARSVDVEIDGGDVRQEAPKDFEDANVYYRSQDKGHPAITLYKDLITMAHTGVERGRILAPYNTGVRAMIEEATPDDTAAKKAINTEDLQGVLHRQKPPPKKTPKTEPKKPVKYGKKHTEMSAGYIGLRQNNADVIENALVQLFDKQSTFKKFLAYVGREVSKAGAAPALPPRLALADDHLAGVASAIADLMTSLTVLSVGPGGTPASEPASKPEPGAPSMDSSMTVESVSTVEHMDEDSGASGSLEKAYLDESYVVRKLELSSQRADWILQNVGKLQRIRLARTGLNPQITVELLKHDGEVGDGEHITFVNAVRVYFGSLVTRKAVESGAGLAIAQRQSFGFLDSSVTDTGGAFRISIGTEPSEMLQAIRDALVALDAELATAHTAKPAKRRAFAGQTQDRSQPLKTFAKSADAKYLGYWGAISKNQNLGAFLGGAPAISAELAANGGGKRGALMANSSAQAAAALAKLHKSTARTSEVTGAMRDELGIVEPLQNMLLMAADALTSCTAWDPAVLPRTRVTALADLAATIRRGQAAVDHYARALGDTHDTEQRVVAHSGLRNATEDIMESLVVFLATTDTFTDSPEDAMTEMLGALYEMPVDLSRTDGGEQAGAVAIAGLRQEQTQAGQDFGLDIHTGKSYFEYASFLKQSGIEHGDNLKGATATFIDPRPYETTVHDAFDGVVRMREKVATIAEALRAAPGKPSPTLGKDPSTPPAAVPPGHTILLDVTNIDLLSREVTQLVAGLRDLIDANKLRVVLINSGVKHEQQGTDRYQVGRIVVIGEPIEGVNDTTNNTLISQFLHMTQRLRMHDAAPVAVHERGYLARSLLGSAKRYTLLIESFGEAEAWKAVLAECAQVPSKDGATGSKLLDVGTSKTELDASADDDAALRGQGIIDMALARLVGELRKEKPASVADDVFKTLPSLDRDAVRRAVAPDTGSSSKTTGGTKQKPRVVVPALQPDGQPQPIGVSNVGNTCYLSAGLSVLAAVDSYYQLFAPVDHEPAGKATLRAQVRAILTSIRAGQAVRGGAIEALLDQLDGAGLLPRPSVQDRLHGIHARIAQHDLSEVMFRMLIDHMGPPGGIQTTHVHQSDFTGQTLAPTGGSAAQLSALPHSGVLREVQNEVLIELPMMRGSLDAIIAALRQPELVQDVRVSVDGVAHAGPAQRSEHFEGAPRVLAFSLKRFDFLEKNEQPVDMPTQIQWNGYHYQLQAVGYHIGRSIGGGHYTASTRGDDGQWNYRDDSSVTPQSDEHLESRKNYGTLFTYVRGAQVVPQVLLQPGPGVLPLQPGPQPMPGSQPMPQLGMGSSHGAPVPLEPSAMPPFTPTGASLPSTPLPLEMFALRRPSFTLPLLPVQPAPQQPTPIATVRTGDPRTQGEDDRPTPLSGELNMDIEH